MREWYGYTTQAGRQTDSQTVSQSDRQTDRCTHTQPRTHTHAHTHTPTQALLISSKGGYSAPCRTAGADANPRCFISQALLIYCFISQALLHTEALLLIKAGILHPVGLPGWTPAPAASPLRRDGAAGAPSPTPPLSPSSQRTGEVKGLPGRTPAPAALSLYRLADFQSRLCC